MAQLIARLPTGERRFELVKSVTSIGRDPQSDVRLELGKLELRHAHVLNDKGEYRLFTAPGARVSINGKKKDSATLADGDVIELGGVTLEFRARSERSTGSVPPPGGSQSTITPSTGARPAPAGARPSAPPLPRPVRPATAGPAPITSSRDLQLEAFKRLHTFTARLAGSPSFDVLKQTLVDLVIELTEADSGFLILLGDQGSTEIIVARDRSQQDLPREGARVSDSIVAEVVAKRRPLLIQNALEDTLFGDSRSVINFKIRSVLALPVLLRDEVLGVLYLGSDRLNAAFSEDAFDVLLVFAAQAGLLIESALVVDGLRAENQELRVATEERAFGEIIGTSSAMQDVFRAVSRLAPSDISVLVLGETGTGKELIAHELHRRSPRASGPFVAINVSAIPENLLESELFGHVRGAFTGAVQDRKGKFQAAHGGTLFLDEIGDMPTQLQAKLLRVLQDRVLERVGSNTLEPIDIRVISATHRDLGELGARGAFRTDLFFRINEAQVTLPALRDRGDDIVLLARFFLGRANQSEKTGRAPPRLGAAAIDALRRYHWPGNVRELEAKMKRALLMAEGPELEPRDLGLEAGAMEPILPLRDAKERYAREYILEILERNGGNRSQTARDLDVDPRTIFKYLEGK